MRMKMLLAEAVKRKKEVNALKSAKAHLFNATYAFRRAGNAVLRNDAAALALDINVICTEIENAKGELQKIGVLSSAVNNVKKCLNAACKELKVVQKELKDGTINADAVKCANDKFDESFNLLFTLESKLLSGAER